MHLNFGLKRPTVKNSSCGGLRSFATNKSQKRILITGSLGQIGTELAVMLRKQYGKENVIASDIRKPSKEFANTGPFVYLDVLNYDAYNRIVVENDIDWIIHNTALLSAAGEKNPLLAIELNNKSLQNALEISKFHNLRIFAPSSIAAFGPSTPPVNTPDLCIMRPTTIYGITKLYLELLGDWYYRKHNVDFRSLRYPGIISSETLPGGGTTDYAVEIFYEAIQKKKYNCFLKPESELPMMYMPDCLQATKLLLEAPSEKLTQRVYNVAGCSFTPAQIAAEIKKHIPEFSVTYNPDFRQQIADSWPKSLDDSIARKDWGWKHTYDLSAMTKDMLQVLTPRLTKTK